MRELSTSIEIYAPACHVWKILTDFEKYQEWNPFIRSITGEPKEGSRLKVFIQPPGSGGMTFRPIVLKAEQNRELRWLAHLFVPGLFDGEHRFVIEPIGENRVVFIQAERFKGLLVPVFWKFLESRTREGFNEMNEALKRLANVIC